MVRLWLELRRLEKLVISGNIDITKEEIAKLNVPRLKELHCDNFPSVDFISQYMPRLDNLNG